MSGGGSEYYLPLIEKYGQLVGRPGGAGASRQIEPEIEKIEDAIGACLDAHQYPGRGVRQGLGDFMRFSGLGDPRLLTRMANEAEAAGDAAEAAQCLLAQGKVTARRSGRSEAARCFSDAQGAFESIADASGAADCRLSLANLARIAGDNSKAIALIDDARRLYSTAEDTVGLGRCDCDAARTAFLDQRIDDATSCVSRALQTAMDSGDTRLQAEALCLAAHIALKTGRTGDAEVANKQALDIYRDCGDVLGQAVCTLLMSTITDKNGDTESSLRNLLAANSLYSRAQSAAGQAICRKRLGDADKANSRFVEAAQHYDAAIEFSAAGESTKLLPAYLTFAGACYLDSSDLAKAEDRYGRALELFTEVQSGANRAICTKQLALIALRLGDRDRSRSLYQSAIETNAASGCTLEEAFCRMGLAKLESDVGEKTRAITQFRLASDRFGTAGNTAGQGLACFREAELLLSSNLTTANERYLAAYECYKGVGTAPGSKMMAMCAQRLGILARQRGEFDGAKALFEEAEQLHRQSGSTESEALAIIGLAETARQQRKWREARELYDKALALYRLSGNRTSECDCLSGAGYNELGSGNRQAAYKHLRTALALSRVTENKISQGNVHIGLGILARTGFEFEDARREFDAALDLFTQAESRLSIGTAHKNLATVSESASDFVRHLGAARAMWSAIGYEQGLKALDKVRQPRRRNEVIRSVMRAISRFMRAVDI